MFVALNGLAATSILAMLTTSIASSRCLCLLSVSQSRRPLQEGPMISRKAPVKCFTPLKTSNSGLWLAGNQGMEKKMEATIMGHSYIGTTITIHSFFIPS